MSKSIDIEKIELDLSALAAVVSDDIQDQKNGMPSYKDDLEVIRRSAHLLAGAFRLSGI